MNFIHFVFFCDPMNLFLTTPWVGLEWMIVDHLIILTYLLLEQLICYVHLDMLCMSMYYRSTNYCFQGLLEVA